MSNQSAPFRVEIRHQHDSAILDLRGEIDGFADQEFGAAYEEATEPPPARLLLNFADVEYINSTGIAVIVSILTRARRDQLPLLACGLSEHYQEIFRITRLADFMHVYADEESALGYESEQ